MKFDALYLVYWSVTDPLTQSQSLPILRALSKQGYELGLITFEDASLVHDAAKKEKLHFELERQGIRWFPLRYHCYPRLFSTLWDICQSLWLCLKLGSRARVSMFHSRGTVTGAPASVAARFLTARFFFDADGPLSEEYADAGVWSKTSLSYRLTHWAERRFLRAADAVAVLSQARKRELERCTVKPITVLPCAVDTNRFRFDDGARTKLRQDLGLKGTVFVYAGKWGGWYATEEMLDLVATVRKSIRNAQLLILSQGSHDAFRKAAATLGINDILVLRSVPWESMPTYLSAADVGLSIIRPLPSKKACSPVKNGEYLACGLPIVSTQEIGDYSELIVREKVGVIVSRLSPDAYRDAARSIGELLLDPELRSRCRRAACANVGLAEVVVPRYQQIYEELIGLLLQKPSQRKDRLMASLQSTGLE